VVTVDLLSQLREQRLLAIVRGTDPDASLRTILTLVEEGVVLIEVSLTSADALAVLHRAVAEVSSAASIGAGTVVSADQARAVRDTGATFVVTPGTCPAVREAELLGLPVLAGAYTPSEAIAAASASAVKLFPAATGGPGHLKALRDPFPHLSFVPVGGIDADRAADYLRVGAVAVGVGSPLLGDAAGGGDLARLRDRARAFREAIGRAP
jgi:2-dehydro-3-deoxyphosphogluconate aldolase / (4S)-4-hydroxy-2-oxoglutarate aldolase